MRRLLSYISKFFYYGYHGAENCVDYCASGVYAMEYAHLKRVTKFMKSDKTHLVWNSKDKGLRRKLEELTELSRRMRDTDGENIYYFSKVMREQDMLFERKNFFTVDYPSEEVKKYWKKRMKRAMKKDRDLSRQRIERYHELRKLIPKFWD